MLLIHALLALAAFAPSDTTAYRTPPAEIEALVTASPAPSVGLSPDAEWMLLATRPALPSLADLSRRMLRLAGIRIDPQAAARFRTTWYDGLVLRDRSGEREVRVPLGEGARLASWSWSHTSRHFSFVVASEAGASELWVADVERPDRPVRLSERVNTVLLRAEFEPRGDAMLFAESLGGEEPAAPQVPAGPNVEESGGEKSPLRTYQDLLSSPHEEALFDHYARVQLVRAALDGTRTLVGEPGVYRSASSSPDGSLLLVSEVHRPYSYLMPYSSFPYQVEVWDAQGEHVHTVASVPAAENIPIGGVARGPRSVSWRPGHPATLVWVEALDGGDPKREVEHRDRWLFSSAPFADEPVERLRVEERAWGLSFFAEGDLCIAREYDRDRRWVRSTLHDLARPEAAGRTLEDRSIRDRYGDPGRLVTTLDEAGSTVVRQFGDWVYRAGSGASPEGMLPFLDRQNLASLETERLWRCSPETYESVAAVVDEERFVTRHETPTSPPNYRLHELGAEETRALTQFPDPTPQLRSLHKELVTYERADGIPLSATLYLPADYEDGTRLPLVVWAYPIEFNDPSTAGQVSSSPWRFTRVAGTSHLSLLTQGYAVLDGATMPVVGDPETMNDTFVEQIVAAAQAAIDFAVERGVADPDRVAVGGHSYGAFMTANLLAHSDLFRTGIARSGAYNRSLTPFGFQSERRTFWEAPEAYFSVSPFMHAHAIDEPLLMIHGEIDNNSGTFPMQSRRMFQAIKGNGGIARLVMLPYEGHGYRARESVLHVQAEMVEWLERHMGPRVEEAGAVEASSRDE